MANLPVHRKSESAEVAELHRLLQLGTPELVGPNGGERIPLPANVYVILKEVVRNIREGRTVSIVPEEQFVTTQKAADILGMSRPHIVKLLEAGAVPFHRTGSHRRVLLKDLMTYAKRRDTERREILRKMSRETSDAGDYSGSIPQDGEDD